MMEEPGVSVCLDSFNYSRFLPEAITSVLDQTFEDFELVIADDCSTDDSVEIAQSFARKDSRVRVHVASTNQGMVVNRNVCLNLARGKYVKWLHADDFLCTRDVLARMVAPAEANSAVVLVASARRIVDEQSRPTDTWSSFTATRPLSGTSVINRCLFEQRNLIGGPSAVLFRRALACRGFDPTFFVMADLEMWFHLLEQGCFVYLNEPLCAFRSHGRQQTEKDRHTLAPALENRALLRRYLPKPYVQLRRWIREYLEFDSLRRLVTRARKLGLRESTVEEAVRDGGGWKNYRAALLKNRYREALLKVRRIYERHLHRPPKGKGKKREFGINVSGFVHSVYGIGESSRAFWRAIRMTELPSVLIPIRSPVHSNADVSITAGGAQNPFAVNLMTFSFDYSRRFYRDMGRRFFAGRYNIGLWYWEQEQFPLRWHSSFDYYDEIWVVTEFTRAAIAAVSPIPVVKMTYPLHEVSVETADRSKFGIADRDFVFLFTFDFFSTMQRKNPEGIIRAFRRAFDRRERVTVVLKSINAHADRMAREFLAAEAKGLNVVFIDEHFTPGELNGLFALSDCYISLHRSEGLGLGMAQAMSLGKPVIATGYSGNLEFMNPGNSFLVRYEYTELSEQAGFYQPGLRWAEPDIDDAARLMRFVFDCQEQAMEVGARGAVAVRQLLAPPVTASEISHRLQAIARY